MAEDTSAQSPSKGQAIPTRPFRRRESNNLATPVGSVASGHGPRASFHGPRPQIERLLGENLNQHLRASSMANSGRSVDIANPDPHIVEVVGRHLVNDADYESAIDDSAVGDDEAFMSLKLQGGDMTREIYKWQQEHAAEENGNGKRGRSRSFDMPRPVEVNAHGEPLDHKQIMVPGGFRRDFISNLAPGTTSGVATPKDHTSPGASNSNHADASNAVASYNTNDHELGNHDPNAPPKPTILTRNFIEFLSLYGHFAGEELEEDEDSEESDSSREVGDERTALLATFPSQRPQLTRRLSQQVKGQASFTETVLLLLKSFVGTGVLFLPRAFYNGGILFSSIVLGLVSLLSYWCFLLMIEAKSVTQVSSFGDLGGALFGPTMRRLILAAIVISQIGFASAYIVFVSENMRVFIENVWKGSAASITTLISAQLIVFLPLSMIRDIAKLGFTALIADFFILLGLVYLYGWGSVTVLTEGISDVALFNKSNWTLFIGTAIFTFEGIGLIIPIQESMRQPEKFHKALGGVMIGITLVFISSGALLYAACGSKVETVILLNLPKGSAAVNTIQLLYSLAILLSTPLQLFPAIRIMENWLFVKSGKYSRTVKWQKNLFRFGLVFLSGTVAYVGANDLDKFVALVGSFACVPLVYIFPPMLHQQVTEKRSFMYYADATLIVFGVFLMIYTTLMTARSWIG